MDNLRVESRQHTTLDSSGTRQTRKPGYLEKLDFRQKAVETLKGLAELGNRILVNVKEHNFIYPSVQTDQKSRITALGYLTLIAVPTIGFVYFATSSGTGSQKNAVTSFANAWQGPQLIQPYCSLEGKTILPVPMSTYLQGHARSKGRTLDELFGTSENFQKLINGKSPCIKDGLSKIEGILAQDFGWQNNLKNYIDTFALLEGAYETKELIEILIHTKDPGLHIHAKAALLKLRKKEAGLTESIAEKLADASDPKLRKIAKDILTEFLRENSKFAPDLAEKFVDADDPELREYAKEAFLILSDKNPSGAGSLAKKFVDADDPALREFSKEAVLILSDKNPVNAMWLIVKLVNAKDNTLREFGKEKFATFLGENPYLADVLIKEFVGKNTKESLEFLEKALQMFLTNKNTYHMWNAKCLIDECLKLDDSFSQKFLLFAYQELLNVNSTIYSADDLIQSCRNGASPACQEILKLHENGLIKRQQSSEFKVV